MVDINTIQKFKIKEHEEAIEYHKHMIRMWENWNPDL